MPIDPQTFAALSRPQQEAEVRRLTAALLGMESRALARLYQHRMGERPYWVGLKRKMRRTEVVRQLLQAGLFTPTAPGLSCREQVNTPTAQFGVGFEAACYYQGDARPLEDERLAWARVAGEIAGRLCRADYARRRANSVQNNAQKGAVPS